MNIIFLTLSNINSLNDSGIYIDLMNQFVSNGHQIYIVSPTERRHKKATYIINEKNHSILKVWTGNITKSNLIEKGLATLAIESQYKQAIKKYFREVRFDLVLYSTPPITLTNVVEYIKKRDRAHTYLLLKDIFPQNSVDLKMIPENSLLHKYFISNEVKLYKISDFIGCMSQANVDYVIKHNPFIKEDKIEICPNSIEPINIKISPNDIKNIRTKYGVPLDKTIFIYGGNLGKPQGIDFLMQCLKENEKNDKAFMIIAGSGTEYERLKDFFDKEELKNAKLFSHIPKDDYDLLVNTCDVGLIFLDNRFTIPNFPSRMLSYMQAAIPILAFTDPSTDIGKVIENGGFGYWAESGDVEAFQKNVERMCNDSQLRETMGINGRNYLESHYTVKHSYEIIMKHFI